MKCPLIVSAGWISLGLMAGSGIGKEPPVIENDYVRLTFAPEAGGMCKSCYYKPAGKELVLNREAGGGLFQDRFWLPSETDYGKVKYDYELTRTPTEVVLHLWGTGSGSVYMFTELHKTITLTSHAPLIKVEYEIRNAVSSQTDYEYALVVRHDVGMGGEAFGYYAPTKEGIKQTECEPSAGAVREIWHKDPARGWLGVVGASRHGLVWGMKCRQVNLFHEWVGKETGALEWRYNKVLVPYGKSFKTVVTLMPFTGLTRIDGYGGGLAGAVGLPGEDKAGETTLPTLSLVSSGDREVLVKGRYRVLPETQWTECGQEKVALTNAQVREIVLKPVTLKQGTMVFSYLVYQGDQVQGEFERPLVVGQSSGEYGLAPEEQPREEKETAAEASAWVHELSTEVVTPHIDWAKPYYKGPLRALILTDNSALREIVELAERMDLQVDTVKFLYSNDEGEYREQGDWSVRTLDASRKRLKEKLKKTYDVIMVAGLDWTRNFDPEICEEIVKHVKRGTGLVLIGPVGLMGELSQTVGAGVPAVGNWGAIKVEEPDYLTTGIPYKLLPDSQVLTYSGTISTEVENILITEKDLGGGDEGKVRLVDNVLLSLQDKPFLSYGTLGQGRILTFRYNMYPKGPGYMKIQGKKGWGSSQILPLNNGLKDGEYHYWEYYFSQLGKALLWAAGKEPEIEELEVNPAKDRKELTLRMKSKTNQPAWLLVVTYRDKVSNAYLAETQKVNVAKGEQTLNVPLAKVLSPELNLIDVQVKDQEGKVVTWASTWLNSPKAEVAIAKVDVENPMRRASERRIRATVTLKGVAPTDCRLKAQGYDYYGRLLFELEKAMTESPVVIETMAEDLLTMPVKLVVALWEKERLLDRQEQTIFFIKERVWDPKQLHFSSWYYSPRRGNRSPIYSTEFLGHVVDVLGIDNVIGGGLLSAATNNCFGSSMGLCQFGFFYDSLQENYLKPKAAYTRTKNPKYLIRDPSLTDPVYRETAKSNMLARVRADFPFSGAHDYGLGDEMTLTSYSDYFDFDQSPSSVAGFRKWLQKKYGDLAALNREWESAYENWNEIMPITAEQVSMRANGNYAPWGDFRTYMDDVLAEFVTFLQKSLEEVDPQAKISISGTQAPCAGNGMDWWKLCHSFKCLHSYNVGQEHVVRSFSRLTGTLISPYGTPRYTGNYVTILWCLCYEAYGFSICPTPSFFYPDLSLALSGQEVAKVVAKFRSGIWELIRNTKRHDDRIAIHYSQPSIQGSFITGKEQSVGNWLPLLHDCGYQFDFVAYEQLETPGFLSQEGYKALILPASIALSDKEAESIKAFVKGGGLVVADTCTGWMNQHCRLLAQGQLDEVLGLSVERKSTTGKGQTLTAARDWSKLKAQTGVEGLAPMHAVMASGAEPVLTAPEKNRGAVYLHKYGQGQAVYLNLNMNQYAKARKSGGQMEGVFQEIIKEALSLGGVPKPAVTITGPSATNLFHGSMVTFTDGSRRYLGVFPQGANYTLNLPGSYEIYDIYNPSQPKYLGKSQTISLLPDQWGGARLFCLTPEKLRPPELIVTPSQQALGETIAYTLQLPQKEDAGRMIHVQVYNPQGKLCSYYSSSCLLKPGETRTEKRFRLALNDPTGNWTIKAMDVVSGDTATQPVTVVERPVLTAR